MRFRWEPRHISAPPNSLIQAAAQPAGGYCFPDLSYRSALIPGNVKFETPRASVAPAKEGRWGEDTLGFVLPRVVPNQQRGSDDHRSSLLGL